MPQAELLKVIYQTFKSLPRGSVQEISLTEADERANAAKAAEPNNFDGANLKLELWRSGVERHKYLLAGRHTLLTVGRPSARLLEAMARVLSAMNEAAYTVYFFMSEAKRLFPAAGQTVGPVNVNGGYCMACDPRTIVIYRREDALRVLIHELQHAACLDDHSAPEPAVEAATEAWAEIFYAMFGAVVHGLQPEEAWAAQTAWSAAQNRRLREEFGVYSPADYAWRYTVGKEEVWRSMDLPIATPGPMPKLLQLGAPKLDVI
jgi:hypothetical protein